MERVRRQAENEWPQVETVPCRATPGTPHSRLRWRGWEKRGKRTFLPSDTPPLLPNIQPCTLDAATRRSHTVWNWGHAGGGESPRGTYRGTGRCNQGRGLCNSGWRRSWLGNLGSLMGQRGSVRYPAVSWGHGQLGAEVFIVFLQLVTDNPQVSRSLLHNKLRAGQGIHFLISLNLRSAVNREAP